MSSVTFSPSSVPNPAFRAPAPSYIYQMYIDNWSGQTPSPPPGASEDYAFAVVNNDGSFDTDQYPINVPEGATDMSLAIGGWNNSQSTVPPWGPNGFYVLVNSINPDDPSPGPLEQTFLENIGETLRANPQAWSSVTLDFENYDHTLGNRKYTKLALEVADYLRQNFPGVKLQMAISPSGNNRDYFDIQALAAAGIRFQVMFYDFALGQDPSNLRVLPNAPVYGPSGEETIAGDLQGLVQRERIPQNQILIGIPGYGVAYNCQPGITPNQIQIAIDTWSLPANSYATPNGQITDDQILQLIGDWDNPSGGWEHFADRFGNVYYYNSSSGEMIAANPPSSFRQQLVPLIRSSYPDVAGFFQWEEVGNSGLTMLEVVMQAFSGVLHNSSL